MYVIMYLSMLFMNTFVTVTQARQNFFKLIEQAHRPGCFITISVEGEPKVIMMSVEDFEGWQETLEIMSDSVLSKSLHKTLREKNPKTYSLEEVKKRLKL